MEIRLDGCLDGLDGWGATAASQIDMRRPIDIEALLQWTVAQSGRLPWRRDTVFDLTLNPYTVRLRRQHVGWALAETYVGLRLNAENGRQVVERHPARPLPRDARIVLDAVMALDGATAATVIACARAHIRPDWMPGVEPRQVERMERCRKKHRSVRRVVWEPCSPEQIRAVRAVYSRWHEALTATAKMLRDELSEWRINGFAAAVAPWEEPVAKTD